MNRSIPLLALLAAFSLAACDRPTVVTVPTPVAVPGPAGTTAIVMPAASAPAN